MHLRLAGGPAKAQVATRDLDGGNCPKRSKRCRFHVSDRSAMPLPPRRRFAYERAMRGMNRAAVARSSEIAPRLVFWRAGPRCARPWPATPWRLVVGIGVSLIVADCASQSTLSRGGGGIDPKLGVRASRRVYEDGDPIPKGGGSRLVGHSYSVAGRTYVL